MRLVSIGIGFGLNDPSQVLLDIPDGWDLDAMYKDWNLARRDNNYTSTFAQLLKERGAKEPENIERYP